MKNQVTVNKSKSSNQWRNRIIGEGVEHPEQLLANPKNWRIHPREQQAALTGMLEEVGWVQRVIVNKRTGFVVDGHMRVEVAISAGEAEVPVLYVDLTEEEEAKVLATFDPISGMAAMDAEKFKELVSEIEFASKDAAKSIESAAENAGVEMGEPATEADAEPQIDRAAELNKKWQVKTGDLWRIGEHRLLCGDSTKREDVQRVTHGDVPTVMVTDPPYGVDYEGGTVNEAKREKLEGDDSTDLFAPALALASDVMPIGAWYVWHADRRAMPVYAAISAAGYDVRALLIWNKLKAHYGAPSAHYCQKHEPCLYAVRGNADFTGASNECTVWDIEQPSRNEHHPTQKPLECMARAVGNHGKRGAVVFDPFLGSGTTMVACENLGRKCRGIEISPDYCAVILERMQTAFPKLTIERVKK